MSVFKEYILYSNNDKNIQRYKERVEKKFGLLDYLRIDFVQRRHVTCTKTILA